MDFGETSDGAVVVTKSTVTGWCLGPFAIAEFDVRGVRVMAECSSEI